MAFLDKIAALRAERGISKNKFCADVGINKNSIANWEKRGNIPDGEVLARIASYFHVTVDYLLDAEKPAVPDGEPPAKTEAQRLRDEIYNMLSEIPDAKLASFKALLQATIDAVK